MESLLWERVGELTDRAPRLSDLRHHKLHLLAASRRRARGEEIPADLVHDERFAAALALSAATLMRHVRAATDAEIVVMKGPEVAAHWPQARLRPWKDLDLLVADAHAVQRDLLAAGFVEIGDPSLYEDIHHLRPLAHPSLPVTIEVHMRPKWPDSGRAPTFEELHERGVESTFSLPGVVAPCPAHHAVMLAVHAWEHDPLSRIGSLVDVAALALVADPDETAAVARDWDVTRVWAATMRAIDDLLFDTAEPARAPIWRRHLHDVRERTVFEVHVEKLVGPVAGAPLTAVPGAATRAIARTLKPDRQERWSQKLWRSRRALSNASLRRSDHLDEIASRRRSS
jgi:hypothetical protein